ncbi:cobalt-precorrin 5A hydrolase [Desulfosarcina ovata]|uniref:Cobalamin biosynthesis protein CbiG n=2 Tax=Desulfosarcina ovata TaxID=83564 RepID=A0A5K8A738_9BACT|nr:cobalt-precorrin 5A hydrolase [Desulfosarcina ovata]BBO80489.1 cobalamin biosynthesis protein CbiG [Desulfosarcina ovata subsp. sediminis]BBO88443.1 cobalamin biosynthesis protein CbiG [Desulfosarcina ovata subsp. ovata]
MKSDRPSRTAVWALTPNGARLAWALSGKIADSELFLSTRVAAEMDGANRFERLADEVDRVFNDFSGHIFIMATGIVIRSIAGHLVHKTRDPAVVVCDEAGQFAISLLSGHLGGANALAREVAGITGGQPVVTTATDVNRVAAIDLIAATNRLAIENPAAIKTVNMALITGAPIRIHDPYGIVIGQLPAEQVIRCPPNGFDDAQAAVFVDHIRLDLPPHVLVLRPPSLVAGMGCNRGTDVEEMRGLLETTLAANHLAPASLRTLATVDLKADEPGLVALAETLNVTITIFTRDRLKTVAQVPNPSPMVEKHIGVKSVCEAAALLATHWGRMLVPKQKTTNVTVAVAADGSISSASVPADRPT